jgi:2,4-dienoyl-CoA reductase-like NADH-dependent reductase (Old Yellow Enzyme family)/thioredoxin reductase
MNENTRHGLIHLFSPLAIHGITLQNRIVSTAHSTGLNDGPRFGERLLAYYEARARGGVGLIITGSTSVHPTSTSRLRQALCNWDDSIIAEYQRLAAVTHRYGTRVFAQLNHAGAQSGAAGGVGRIVAPSAVDSELGVETPHALDVDEIHEIIDAFAAAAIRVRSGGLDGIELHGAHGNLIQQFLSPLTNQREDEYGGTAENRLRFVLRLMRAVRKAVGPEFLVGIRISAQEDHPGGLTLAVMRSIVPTLVAAGSLDYVSVTSGSDSTTLSLAHHYAPMYVRGQPARHLAREIKQAVAVPVLVAGRIVDPRDAEAILAAGDADLVGMTRALIADRDLPAKARRGELSDIRPCVGVNEGCLGRLMRGLPITCIQDPTSGRERELGTLLRAAAPRRVVVVGGGVAGLEAARVAAVRGHHVTLLEQLPELGGQVQLARRAPGRAELGAIVDYLVHTLEQHAVEIRYGVEANVEMLLGLDPAAVVVATGSDPRLPCFPESDARLVSAHGALSGDLVGDKVAIFDTKGDMVGLTTADWLVGRRHEVVVVTSKRYAGSLIEPMTWRLLYQRLLDQGVRFITESEVVRLTEEGIVVRHLVSGQETTLPEIATVVAACGGNANDGLYRRLRRAAPGLETHLVGDAVAPRQIEQAIFEGHIAARKI